MSTCHHDLGWVYVLDGADGYTMRCATCGVPRPSGMVPTRASKYPRTMLIGAAIVLAGAFFLVALVFWWTWLA